MLQASPSSGSSQSPPTQVPMSSMRSSLGSESYSGPSPPFNSQPTPASAALDSPFAGTSSSSSGSAVFPSPALPDFHFSPALNPASPAESLTQQIAANDLFDFGMMDLSGYAEPGQVPTMEDGPGVGEYNKQNLWSTFIEGLMDDTVTPLF